MTTPLNHCHFSIFRISEQTITVCFPVGITNLYSEFRYISTDISFYFNYTHKKPIQLIDYELENKTKPKTIEAHTKKLHKQKFKCKAAVLK